MKGKVERHFGTVHKNYNPDLPPKGEMRKRKVKELKLSRQQSFFPQLTTKAKATEATFRVSHFRVKNKKYFQDGEMAKEAFVEAADFRNKPEILSSINALQLSQS